MSLSSTLPFSFFVTPLWAKPGIPGWGHGSYPVTPSRPSRPLSRHGISEHRAPPSDLTPGRIVHRL